MQTRTIATHIWPFSVVARVTLTFTAWNSFGGVNGFSSCPCLVRINALRLMMSGSNEAAFKNLMLSMNTWNRLLWRSFARNPTHLISFPNKKLLITDSVHDVFVRGGLNLAEASGLFFTKIDKASCTRWNFGLLA